MDIELSQSLFDQLLNQLINKLRTPTFEDDISDKFPKTRFRAFSISENVMLTQQWLLNVFSTQEQKRALTKRFFELTDPRGTLLMTAGQYYERVN